MRMMSLQEKLNLMKASFEEKAPTEALQIMHRATEELRNSGIVEKVVKVGNSVPFFELKNADEEIIRLKDLLSEGPLVLSFYRGKW
jgi:hypothetical protein